MRDELDQLVTRFGLDDEVRDALDHLLRERLPTLVDEPIGAEDEGPSDGDGVDDGERYEDRGGLGVGGMAEVREVFDRRLGRNLARKVIHPHLQAAPGALERFLAEAQVTAQLEHPGIVPVHDLGRLPDGRTWFTMKKVRGQTLADVIAGVHSASGTTWGTAPGGWTLHRLVDAVRRVCEAVAHAHAHGVIHRDLKPDNVMVGAHGEVLVLDWGLARTGTVSAPEIEPVRTVRDESTRTRTGTVAGTPVYMSPEQARGEVDRLTPASDVYALGAILFEALYGRPPYEGTDVRALLERVKAGAPPPPALPRPVPGELVELWQDAMRAEPDARPAQAGVLAERITQWQEGARRRERAAAIVAEADAALPRLASLRRSAEAHADEAERLGRELQPWDPVDRKRPVWELEDAAESLAAEAEREELRITELLRAALTQAPDFAEARARLADLYQARHAEAERARDVASARRYEQLLRAHDDGRHSAWLEGEGTLTLRTEPPGATAELLRYNSRDRRLVPELQRTLGTTPIEGLTLPMGSWLVVLRAPGRAEVRYPVWIDRLAHHDGVRPGDAGPTPVELPPADALGPDDVYVPAGWFVAGGDKAASGFPWRREWLDGFVMRRFPVTNREFLAFLGDLVATGREDDALAWAPRERGSGRLVYGRDAEGRFHLRQDPDGDPWLPDYPVVLVTHEAATAYARWTAERTDQPWRLPTELEWEKAARGPDGRFFPWGDGFDATWARCRSSQPGRPLPAVVQAFPTDESPYGIRGMAGNVADWCADAFEPDPDADRDTDVAIARVYRGGAWSYDLGALRLCNRRSGLPRVGYETVGFRLARSLH